MKNKKQMILNKWQVQSFSFTDFFCPIYLREQAVSAKIWPSSDPHGLHTARCGLDLGQNYVAVWDAMFFYLHFGAWQFFLLVLYSTKSYYGK